MESIAKLVVSVFDLAEAEASLFRTYAVNTIFSTAIALAAVAFGAVGLVFFGIAIFRGVEHWIGPALAYAAAGAFFAGVAVFCLLFSRRAAIVRYK